MRRVALMIGVAALAAASVAGLSTPASAHDVLVSSSPADGATVPEPPSSVTLTFSNAISDDFAQIAVLGPDQTTHQQGDAQISGPTVTQSVDPLPAGTYTVSYRIVSSDGHPVSGTVSFTVAGPGTAPPPATSTRPTPSSEPTTTAVSAPDDEDDDGVSATTAVVLVVAGAVVIGGIAFVAAGGWRRGTPSDTGTDD